MQYIGLPEVLGSNSSKSVAQKHLKSRSQNHDIVSYSLQDLAVPTSRMVSSVVRKLGVGMAICRKCDAAYTGAGVAGRLRTVQYKVSSEMRRKLGDSV